jgi:hypothetical protein
MQYGHGHAAWTRTCSMDTDMQHGHGHAARTRTCSTDTDMQQGHGHAAGTRICSMDTDMQQGQVPVQAVWTSEKQHGHGHVRGQAVWAILMLCRCLRHREAYNAGAVDTVFLTMSFTPMKHAE